MPVFQQGFAQIFMSLFFNGFFKINCWAKQENALLEAGL